MAKEIHEQPEVVARTLGHYLDMSAGRTALPFTLPVDAATLPRLTIAACGTAFIAGLLARYWFERFARLPVEIDVASEFRYREPPMERGGVDAIHFAIGRDRRYACLTALCQGAGPEDHQRRQCRDLDDGAGKRCRGAHARGAGDRRRLDQGLHLPACAACLSGACLRPCPRRDRCKGRSQARHGVDGRAWLDGGGDEARAAGRGAVARFRAMRATCSISAAAPPIRWRSKAR